ncbi:acyltransferase family protein [Mobilicoccus pelagius]|uniref:Putative acyltransferase n=1 Tax=Mobilicoccus pelagius NBRC 104925 TaxID=1089455 RepID=H5UVR7_9MICO|nr:acyltransferase [Mobilicoccus pelagius]GAB49825.1 putative acyltransferase [Mobilicoccus pelagius NBRC 104925]
MSRDERTTGRLREEHHAQTHPRSESPGAGVTLRETFDPRRNSLTMMRLALAALVAVSHALAVAFGWQPQFHDDPALGPTYLGDLAVDGFFVVSGFLVTMSYLRLPGVGRYLWHRVVRIMPAFWACLVVTALVVAPLLAWLEGDDPRAVFPESLRYVTGNAFLLVRDYGVAGLPSGTFTPRVVNGALWTLFYEFLCYVGVVVLGLVGALTRRRHLVLVGIGVLWAAALATTLGVAEVPAWQMRRLALMFLLGVAGYVYAGRLRIDGRLAVLSFVVLGPALVQLPDYRVLASPAFAYLVLWGMVRLPFTWNPRTDLSYGLYIWHWPIVTLLAVAGVGRVGEVGFVLLTLLLSGLVAAVSWRFVESPALAHKSMPAPWARSRRPGSTVAADRVAS